MTDFRALCAELVDELEDWIAYGDEADCADAHAVVDRARAALAQPEPQGPSDEELDEETATLIPWLLEEAVQAANSEAPYAAGQLTLAAQLLGERRPAIEPVPVAERLPGPEDCDAEGRCWWLKQAANPEHDLLTPTWHLQRHGPAGSTFFKFTHWLPHHALPMPQQEANND